MASGGYLWAGQRSAVIDLETQRPLPFSVVTEQPPSAELCLQVMWKRVPFGSVAEDEVSARCPEAELPEVWPGSTANLEVPVPPAGALGRTSTP